MTLKDRANFWNASCIFLNQFSNRLNSQSDLESCSFGSPPSPSHLLRVTQFSTHIYISDATLLLGATFKFATARWQSSRFASQWPGRAQRANCCFRCGKVRSGKGAVHAPVQQVVRHAEEENLSAWDISAGKILNGCFLRQDSRLSELRVGDVI